jgi:hypothetical protein
MAMTDYERHATALRLFVWIPLMVIGLGIGAFGLIFLAYASGESGAKDWVEIAAVLLGGAALFVVGATLTVRDARRLVRTRRPGP